MNQEMVSDYESLLNHQVASQEVLLEYHAKAKALLKVLLGSNLPSYSASTLHDYLSVLDDIVSRAKQFNETLLDVAIKLIVSGELLKETKSSIVS